jgi:hypothetical protein
MKEQGKNFFRQWLWRETGGFGQFPARACFLLLAFGKQLKSRLFEAHPDAFDLGLRGLCHCFRPSPFSLLPSSPSALRMTTSVYS